jgi:hypothetical protein
MKSQDRGLALVLALAALAALTAPHWWPTVKRAPRAPVDDDGPRLAVPTAARRDAPFDPARFALHLDTAHYAIVANATPDQTQRIAAAAESLYAAYFAFFAPSLPAQPAAPPKLQLALYRDRADFQAHNTSQPWAEAFYRRPVCHAYYEADGANPVHWMLHEAVHQLNTERAQLPKTPWIDEGLATYFGTSRIVDGRMHPGEVDPDTYPVWWLTSLGVSGDLPHDLARRRILPLRELIGNRQPPAPRDVNAYYVGVWSLTHFLLHAEDGRYAPAFRELVAKGGSLEEFERRIGPVDDVQEQWYAYLQQRIEDARAVAAGRAARVTR